jgi:hypothetical protein
MSMEWEREFQRRNRGPWRWPGSNDSCSILPRAKESESRGKLPINGPGPKLNQERPVRGKVNTDNPI